jgi:hypothetical protein
MALCVARNCYNLVQTNSKTTYLLCRLAGTPISMEYLLQLRLRTCAKWYPREASGTLGRPYY